MCVYTHACGHIYIPWLHTQKRSGSSDIKKTKNTFSSQISTHPTPFPAFTDVLFPACPSSLLLTMCWPLPARPPSLIWLGLNAPPQESPHRMPLSPNFYYPTPDCTYTCSPHSVSEFPHMADDHSPTPTTSLPSVVSDNLHCIVSPLTSALVRGQHPSPFHSVRLSLVETALALAHCSGSPPWLDDFFTLIGSYHTILRTCPHSTILISLPFP